MAEFIVEPKIVTVEEHPNAERLDIVKVEGFNCVSQKGVYETGDCAIYVPENAVVPVEVLKHFGFWNEEKDKGLLAGAQGNRVKPVKLRGVISEGILLPYRKVLDFLGGDSTYKGLDDYGDVLGIVKYSPTIPAHMQGKLANRDFSARYDIQNWKKYRGLLRDGEEVVATEKIHGTCTIFRYDALADTFDVASKGIASRGQWLDESEDNLYWRVARQFNIREVLSQMAHRLGEEVVLLFGETFGAGVQKGYDYGAVGGEIGYRAFDMVVENQGTQEVVNYDGFKVLCKEFGIPTVPEIYRGPYDPDVLWGHTSGVETVSDAPRHIREGLVVRPIENRYDARIGHVKLKMVSDAYLGKTTGEEIE